MLYVYGNNRYNISENGSVISMLNGKQMKQHDNGKGYKTVGLSAYGKTKKFYIHRLVGESFIPNPANLPDINHIDGNKSNNNVSNLEWMSRGDNLRHAHTNGLFKKYKDNMKENQNQWVGKKINRREVVEVLNEHKNGNYKILAKCDCGNILKMYYNDFKKANHNKCRKCNK